MLRESITEKMKEAMRAGEEVKVGVFRLLLAGLKNREIEKKSRGETETISEEEEIDFLRKEAKKRKEAIEAFVSGNRNDLADKERAEVEIIKSFLPKELTEEETEKIVDVAIEKTNPQSVKDFGRVLEEAMKEAGPAADRGLVAQIIKKKLSS